MKTNKNTLKKLRTGVMVSFAGLGLAGGTVSANTTTVTVGETTPKVEVVSTLETEVPTTEVAEEVTPEVDPIQEAEQVVAQATEVAEQAKEEATEAKEALEAAESAVTEVEEKISPVSEEVAGLESAIQGTDGTALEEAKAQTETLQTGVSDAEKAVDTAVEKQEIAQVNFDNAKQANDALVEAETRLATTLSEAQATVEAETAKVEALETRVADLNVPGKPVTTVVKENNDAEQYLNHYNTTGNFHGGAGESHAQPLYSGKETVVLPYEENFVPDSKEVAKYIKQYVNEIRALNGLPKTVEFTEVGNEYAEFRLTELREKFSQDAPFTIHSSSNYRLSNGDRRTSEVITGVSASTIGNSNQEFAYNIVDGWMTDLFNVTNDMGHAHALLLFNLPKFGFAFDTDSRASGGVHSQGSAIVIQHALTDIANGIFETKDQNNGHLLEDTKDENGKSILLVNGKQVKLFPLRSFQYVRESAPAGEAERLTALTLAKRELEVAKSNLNKANEAVAELSTLGGIEVKAAFTTAQADLNTAKLETLKAQGSLSLARKALNDNLNTIKSLEEVKANIEASKLKIVALKGKLSTLQDELQEAKAKVPALQEANRKAQQAYTNALSELSDAVANLNALKVQTGGDVVEVPVTFGTDFTNNEDTNPKGDDTKVEEAPKGDDINPKGDDTKVEEAPKGEDVAIKEPAEVRDIVRNVPGNLVKVEDGSSKVDTDTKVDTETPKEVVDTTNVKPVKPVYTAPAVGGTVVADVTSETAKAVSEARKGTTLPETGDAGSILGLVGVSSLLASAVLSRRKK